MSLRLGAVGYLNARPLVHGLDGQPDRFAIRFDAPSRCAELLDRGEVDLGLIPSIEYLRSPEYSIVPSIAIASRHAVASVALFTQKPRAQVRTVAIDSSSRTSAALLQILYLERFGQSPRFVTMAPDLPRMLRQCDAALLIGDAALFLDHEVASLEKVDLGVEWHELTGLPFVWAFWAGREVSAGRATVEALQMARNSGVKARDEIAAAYCAGSEERTARGRAYLGENIHFDLGEAEMVGLRRFLDAAYRLGLAREVRTLRFYDEPSRDPVAPSRPADPLSGCDAQPVTPDE